MQEFTLWAFAKVDPKVLEIGSHPNLIEIVEILQGSQDAAIITKSIKSFENYKFEERKES